MSSNNLAAFFITSTNNTPSLTIIIIKPAKSTLHVLKSQYHAKISKVS